MLFGQPDASANLKSCPDDIHGYWQDRKNHDLYRLTVTLARALFPTANSAIDVGCYVSGTICEMGWIPHRVATDINKAIVPNWRGVQGVEFHAGDAFSLSFREPFDLVISNQTIEHLDRPAEFVQKLLKIGHALMISTTYEVAHGVIKGHVQDPISFEKFRSWFPCELDTWMVCHHPTNRRLKHIMAVVSQSHPNRR